MNIEDIKTILQINTQNLTNEFKRIFHGRGSSYKNWEFLTIDSINTILNISFYSQSNIEDELLEMLKEFIKTTQHTTIVCQRRYITKTTATIIVGDLEENIFAIENGIKLKLNLLSNQNNGYFPDMKNGRQFVKENAKYKKILNLFSYTCAFSVFAVEGGAKSVVNFDMAKNALTTGRENHHLNNQDTSIIKFYPHNILKSFGRIKRDGLYDLIIIDPPTFQKGSFEATKDYDKIIKKLDSISSKDCLVLACLNSPNLGVEFIVEIFKQYAPNFEFVKRLKNVKEFVCIDENRSLKNLVFRKKEN